MKGWFSTSVWLEQAFIVKETGKVVRFQTMKRGEAGANNQDQNI